MWQTLVNKKSNISVLYNNNNNNNNEKRFCRVTNCSPHLNRNRKWAQQAQYNRFVREWVKELG